MEAVNIGCSVCWKLQRWDGNVLVEVTEVCLWSTSMCTYIFRPAPIEGEEKDALTSTLMTLAVGVMGPQTPRFGAKGVSRPTPPPTHLSTHRGHC